MRPLLLFLSLTLPAAPAAAQYVSVNGDPLPFPPGGTMPVRAAGGFYQDIGVSFPATRGEVVWFAAEVRDAAGTLLAKPVGTGTDCVNRDGGGCDWRTYVCPQGGWDATGATAYRVTVTYFTYRTGPVAFRSLDFTLHDF